MKRKVVIIDDEEDFCLLMKYYLSKKNCEVNISHTLAEGINMVGYHHPDIIILDNNLPDGLGWSQAKNILKKSPKANLFLISANNTTTKAEEIKHNFQVIEKPLSIKQIDNIIK